MTDSAMRPISRRRYVHLSLSGGDGETGSVLLGLAPAAAGSDVRTVQLRTEDWPALADQLDAAAAALRAHAAKGGIA